MLSYPTTDADLNRWILTLSAFYCVAVYVGRTVRGERIADGHFIFEMVSNAAAFAGSVVLLWGICDPSIIKLLGSLTGYLILGGGAGFFYAVHAIFKSEPRS